MGQPDIPAGSARRQQGRGSGTRAGMPGPPAAVAGQPSSGGCSPALGQAGHRAGCRPASASAGLARCSTTGRCPGSARRPGISPCHRGDRVRHRAPLGLGGHPRACRAARVTADLHCVTKCTSRLSPGRASPRPSCSGSRRLRARSPTSWCGPSTGTARTSGSRTSPPTPRCWPPRWRGQPLTPEHGYPMRLVVPHLYGWKSVKWVRAVEYLTEDRRGFWEERGYHNSADPWHEQRFSYQESGDRADGCAGRRRSSTGQRVRRVQHVAGAVPQHGAEVAAEVRPERGAPGDPPRVVPG